MRTGLGGDDRALRLREQIIEEVGALMGRRRMTQTALAERLRWTQPYLSRRLTGKTAFSTDDLVDIAEAFGVPVTDLFGDPSSRPKSGCVTEDDPAAPLAMAS